MFHVERLLLFVATTDSDQEYPVPGIWNGERLGEVEISK
jgi:hypothetical protein